MDKQKEFEKIEKYHKGKLKGDKANIFKDKMKKDAEFADEVKLHKQMEDALKHSPEDELRASLNRLNHQHKYGPIKKGITGLLSIAVIVLFCTWFFTEEDQQVDQTPVSVPSQNIEREEKPESNLRSNLPVAEATKPTKEIKSKTKQVEHQPIAPSPSLLAVNFEPNPLLETHIGNAIRGGDYEFEITEPQNGARLKIEKNEVIFRFAGLLKTNKRTLNDDFQVHLFSNKKVDYENFRPLFTFPINFDKQGEDFSFQLTHQQKMPKGLYYFLLEDANSGEMFAVGKVLNQ